MYRIREADGCDDAADLAILHELIFETTAPPADTSDGHWWLVYAARDPNPVAFAGVVPSDRYSAAGYYKRVGVLPHCRGHGLQLRLTRVIERRCRRQGWRRIISDTTDNVPCANNFIRAGYRLFDPGAAAWSFPNSLYWTKDLRTTQT